MWILGVDALLSHQAFHKYMHENMRCALLILNFFLTRQAEAQQGTVVNDWKLSERATARTPRTGVGGQYGEDVAVLHGLSALLQAPERRRTTAEPQDTQM